jgi:hypothetical protein
MPLDNVTLFCFFASYFAALALELTQFARGSRINRWGAILFVGAGLIAHTAYLLARSRNAQLPPLLSSTHDWLLVLSWLAAALLLSVQMWDRTLAVGLFVLPPVLVMVGASRFVSDDLNQRLSESGLYWWNLTHASLWVIGVAGLVGAFVLSVMYLVQHRRLKHKFAEPKELHLFSLERLGRWNWWAVIVSVPILTLALASGVFLALRSHGTSVPISLLRGQFIVMGLLWGALTVLFGWLVSSRQPTGRVVAWRTMWACGLLLAIMLVQQIFSRGGIHGTAAASWGRPSACDPMAFDAGCDARIFTGRGRRQRPRSTAARDACATHDARFA